MGIENKVFSQLKGLSENDLKAILARQAKQRLEQPSKKLQDLSNAEIAKREDFKIFCEQNGAVPTKRQASIHKEEFIKWHEENNPE